jgi:NADH dehydrogenase FAD-containing subunit
MGWLLVKNVVLVGAGHTHLYCLKKIKEENLKDINFILISPSPYQYYSGMFSGYTEGIYSIEDTRVDVRLLIEHSSIDFVEDHVIRVDARKKYVVCSNNQRIHFDLISFDIGSLGENPPYGPDNIFPLKPTYLFPNSINQLKNKQHPIIVGGGVSGLELALSIRAFQVREKKWDTTITIVSSKQILNNYYTEIISRFAKKIAVSKGVIIHEHELVIDVRGNKLHTESGLILTHTGLLWLTGPKAPVLFQDSNLEVDNSGYLLVNTYLQSVNYPYIFGAGDCASLKEYPNLPKNGVYAIRQSPILWKNISNFLQKNPLQSFQPQKNYLSIISTGQKQGLLLYNNFYFHHKFAWRLKNRIDRQFIQKYQN